MDHTNAMNPRKATSERQPAAGQRWDPQRGFRTAWRWTQVYPHSDLCSYKLQNQMHNLGAFLNSFLEKVKPSAEAAVLPVTFFVLWDTSVAQQVSQVKAFVCSLNKEPDATKAPDYWGSLGISVDTHQPPGFQTASVPVYSPCLFLHPLWTPLSLRFSYRWPYTAALPSVMGWIIFPAGSCGETLTTKWWYGRLDP